MLQDQMYEPNASWSLPEHLYQASEWSAFCTDPNNPFSCTAMTCPPVQQGPKTPGIWNPLPSFTDVTQDGQLGNLVDDFDFSQTPRPPLILPVCPATDLTPQPTC